MSNADVLTDAYWEATAWTARDATCLVCSTAALIVCACTVRLALRCPEHYLNRVNECILATMALNGIVGSVFQALAAAVRLASPRRMRYVCDLSGLACMLTVVPSVLCEAGFFTIILQDLASGGRGRPDRSVSQRVVLGSVLFGVLSAGISFSILPVDPVWGTRFSGQGSSWCWLPPTDGGFHRAAMYSVLQVVFGYMASAVTACVGVYVFAHYFRVLRAVTKLRALVSQGSSGGGAESQLLLNANRRDVARAFDIPLSVKLRFLYFLCFAATWGTGAYHRYSPAGSQAPQLAVLQAALQPLLPMLNAIMFLASEGIVWRAGSKRNSRHDDELSQLAVTSDEGGGTLRDALLALTSEADRLRGVSAAADSEALVAAAVDALSRVSASSVHNFLRTPKLTKPSMSVMLSLLAGYCDTVGFLTMELFTAHVTGNFATIGMSIVRQSSAGLVVKAGALGVFMTTVAAAACLRAWDAGRTKTTTLPQLWTLPRVLLVSQMVLLLASCLCNSLLGPVGEPAVVSTVATSTVGWLMVAGMAIQNLFQRFWLVGLPMTTLMTGNTVGAIVDFVQWKANDEAAAALRLRNFSLSIFAFLSGCCCATATVRFIPELAFVPPPMLSLAVLALGWDELA